MTIAVGTPDLQQAIDEYRAELLGYCYRMLGSLFDAEDAVQDTLVRAWRSLEGFEGRSALKTWLYRIATNVCLDVLSSTHRRVRPMDLTDAAWEPIEASLAARRGEDTWLEPVLDRQVLPAPVDPADVAVGRDTIRLAFIAALQHLPARQRVVLILRDVLRWKADEVAGLLETTVASVNSALQRARATLDARGPQPGQAYDPLDAEQQDLLARYLEAFESYDIERFVQLLHEDATQNMPPYEMWLQGRHNIVAWMLGPGAECEHSRLLPLRVNGAPGFAQYRWVDGAHQPWAIQVLDVVDGRVQGISSFLDNRLFAALGLPARLDDEFPSPAGSKE